uniref:Uncharacterized protein n=1 Tax=Naja naja TaxID=35670 RepID=A0A8C6VDU0_NAJNA
SLCPLCPCWWLTFLGSCAKNCTCASAHALACQHPECNAHPPSPRLLHMRAHPTPLPALPGDLNTRPPRFLPTLFYIPCSI